ncbi:hypothetical protein [Maridesulfovibrio bastinii]|uniref:hypothetical protein n=1 Tax=Maridesulfovibrio bastinii TaxID=47157 RepID=UPI000428BC1F|nr:hypothetical protein [Maridesulfovibrio bastinii]
MEWIKNNKIISLAIAIGIVNFVGAFIVLAIDHKINFSFHIDSNLAADIGTYLAGTSGTLWGAAGLIVLIQTLKVQQEGIEQQRELSNQQSFETTFFNFLNRYNELQKSIDFNKIDPLKKWSYNCAKYGFNHYKLSSEEIHEEDLIYPDDPRVDYEFYKTGDSYLKEEFEKMTEGMRECQYRIDNDLNSLYILFFQIISALEKYNREKPYYTNILSGYIPWYEFRFIFYWAYVKKNYSNEHYILIRNNIPIQINYLYSPEHAKLFPTARK